MKTLTLTLTTLIVFALANSNIAQDLDSSEPSTVNTPTGIADAIEQSPPAIQRSSAQVSSRGRASGQLTRGSYVSRGASTNTSLEGTERVHVIPIAEITPDEMEEIEKDMNIMCHLLHKELRPSYDSVSRRRSRYGYSYDTWDLATVLGVESQNTEGIYLEGFGALFLIKVNFPLSAPPETTSEQREPKEAIDSAWEQAKQDLYQSGETTKKTESVSPDQYDTYKVEYLKEKLFTALKYAANIKKLGPEDTVVVTVKGRRTAENAANMLTLRTKKSDIDAYSQGDLDADGFRQKVMVLVY